MQSFGKIMFTPAVQAEQALQGSRETYEKVSSRPVPEGLGPEERDFLTTRTSFYMATTSETGWPYIQHRGGPAGFVKLLDSETIGFADYRGNQQYVSKGNLSQDDRVSLFFMDYPRKARLKLLGHARMEHADDAPELVDKLVTKEQGRVERVVTVRVEAFDWNCPRFITPRFDTNELTALVGPEISRLENRIAELEEELASLRNSQKEANS